MNAPAITTRTGARKHMLLSTMTLCGLTGDLGVLMFPDEIGATLCMNCVLKRERLQRRNRKTNERLRRRDMRQQRRGV